MTLSATATACETKEINIESFEEQIEGEENNEREDSVDKTIASVIEKIKNDGRRGTKRKLNGE